MTLFLYSVTHAINELFIVSLISNLLSVVGLGLLIYSIVILFKGGKP